MENEVLVTPRMYHFDKIFEQSRFKDWGAILTLKQYLDQILVNQFPDNVPEMRLVGSSATGTMIKGHEDLDYAVAFQKPVSHEEFINKVIDAGLHITELKKNKDYGYLRVCGKFHGIDFVFVPMIHPNGEVKTFEQDAFYHSDFINHNKPINHARTVVLLKIFFEQIGIYKELKGISCEMMSLYFQDFDSCLHHIAQNDHIRINFSGNNSVYSECPLVIDYPYLGGRSFTDKITPEIFQNLQFSSQALLDDYKFLKGIPDVNT